MQVVHEVVELQDNERRGDPPQHRDHRRHAPHRQVVMVGFARIDVGLVNVVRPDGIKCRDVPCHAGHEAREQRRQADPKQARGIKLAEQRRQRVVIPAVQEFGQVGVERNGDESGQNHQQRKKHFGDRGDQGGALRR